LDDQLVILVIEDDPPIQVVVEDALADGGFEPAIAPSGEEAVTLLRGNRRKYRALVTDINLVGRIDGWELARLAREINPEFPILYITGAHADQWPSRGVPNSVLLTKPFAPAQLVTAVSQLLNDGVHQRRAAVAGGPSLSGRQESDRQHDKPSHNDQGSHRAGGYFGFLFGGVGTHSTPRLAAAFNPAAAQACPAFS